MASTYLFISDLPSFICSIC